MPSNELECVEIKGNQRNAKTSGVILLHPSGAGCRGRECLNLTWRTTRQTTQERRELRREYLDGLLLDEDGRRAARTGCAGRCSGHWWTSGRTVLVGVGVQYPPGGSRGCRPAGI